MITANFKAYASYVTDSLHQWELNQVLQVSGLNLTKVPEVHFSNANIDRAIVRQATMNAAGVVAVGVPNSLLQDPLRIYAHIGIYEGNTFKVVELVEIPVMPRKRPADYQIQATDEEVYSFKALENAIANMATRAQVANIVANASETGNNAELMDVRAASDGEVYASAGESVRGQVGGVVAILGRAGIYAEENMAGTDKPEYYVYKNGPDLVEGANVLRGYIHFDVSKHAGRSVYVSTKTESETMYAYIFTNADGQVVDHINGALDYKTVAEIPADAVNLYVNYKITNYQGIHVKTAVVVKLVDTLDVTGKLQQASQSNQRTDSKMDALAKDGILLVMLPWEFGGINGNTGEDYAPDDYRMRTTGYYTTTRDKIYYIVPDGFRLIAFEYTHDAETDGYTFVKTQGYVTDSGAFSVTPGHCYRFILRGATDFAFTGNEYEALQLYHDCNVFVKPADVHGIMDTYERHPVPAYWEETLAAKESEIKALVVEATKADQDVALFFTVADPHYPANSGVSTALMRYLSKTCGVTLAVCLGDLITDSINSHEEGLERIQASMAELTSMADRMIMTQGNHDNNAGIADGNGKILAERIVYDKEWILHTSAKMLGLNKLVFDDQRKAFYYDDDLQKLRFVSIDAFEGKTYTIENGVVKTTDYGKPSERQIAWIKNTALQNVPDGYAVISFSHLALFAPYISNGQEFVSLKHGQIGNADKLLAVFKEFKAAGGTYVGHFAGHLHHDFVSAYDGIVCTQALNDGTHWRDAAYFGAGYEFVGDAPVKTAGTTTECAFDVVVVNKTTRHVDLVRIGAGNNREFDY